MGAAGPAIILVVSLAAMAVIGTLWLGYVSDGYLNVIQDTAAGLDDVHWPELSVFDWFGRLFQLGWLTLFWLVPSWLIALGVAPAWINGDGGFAQLFFLVFWLIVPISLLSSMSAPSRLLVLYWPFLRRLGKHPVHVVGFYASSGAVLAVGIWCLNRAVTHRALEWVLVGGPAICAGIILHARLVGRLAYQVAYHTPAPKKPRKKRPPRADGVEDPWAAAPAAEPQIPEIAPEILDEPKPAVPEEEEDEWTPNKKAYGVLSDNPTTREVPRAKPSYIEPSDPYEVLPPDQIAAYVLPMDGYRPVGGDAVTAEQAADATKTTGTAQASPFEQRLARRRQLPPRPKILFVSGVYSFLFYQNTLRTWVYMSLGAWILIGLVRLIRSVWIV